MQPWEPQCINNDFAHEVQCGDSWGKMKSFLAIPLKVYTTPSHISLSYRCKNFGQHYTRSLYGSVLGCLHPQNGIPKIGFIS